MCVSFLICGQITEERVGHNTVSTITATLLTTGVVEQDAPRVAPVAVGHHDDTKNARRGEERVGGARPELPVALLAAVLGAPHEPRNALICTGGVRVTQTLVVFKPTSSPVKKPNARKDAAQIFPQGTTNTELTPMKSTPLYI